MREQTPYFVIYSDTSRNSALGLRPKVSWIFDKTIVEEAALELKRCGETLEDMAGIDWIEGTNGDIVPSRELNYDEVLSLSVKKLGDDGRFFIIFDTNFSGSIAFINTAKCFGLEDEATTVVDNFKG